MMTVDNGHEGVLSAAVVDMDKTPSRSSWSWPGFCRENHHLRPPSGASEGVAGCEETCWLIGLVARDGRQLWVAMQGIQGAQVRVLRGLGWENALERREHGAVADPSGTPAVMGQATRTLRLMRPPDSEIGIHRTPP